MQLTKKQFQHYLMVYGTQIEHWPASLAVDKDCIKSDSELNDIWIKQQYMDELLIGNRMFQFGSSDLAERIVQASRQFSPAFASAKGAWLKELLSALLPQPGFTMASMLALGLIIGLSLPDHVSSSLADESLWAYFYDNGALL